MTDFYKIEEIMKKQQSTSKEIKQFSKLYNSYLENNDRLIDWQGISSPGSEDVFNYDKLSDVSQKKAKALLSKLAVCKLNGGLGTSMGCIGPKSVIEIRNGQTFLDMIVTQIKTLNQTYKVNVPLVLMNSFNTDQDTVKVIKKYDESLSIYTFMQNKFPRLRRDSLLPLSIENYGQSAFYPPGHGDFFQSISSSGILDKLIKLGKKYIFVGNADNLGSSVDIKILNLLEDSKSPYIMEVTDKTRADIKGGTLVKNKANSLQLLELAQVPEEYREEFKSVKKFKIFNTNNIWLNIDELKKKIKNNSVKLDIIVNKKSVRGLPILQLETALGSGINSFEGSIAVKVNRMRFLPIKKTDDLLLVQSNIFNFQNGLMTRNKNRQFEGLPLIRLGEYFNTVEKYQARFKSIPNILELDLLTIVGDVYFEKNITLRGNVIIISEGGSLNLPDSSLIENKAITGSLKMGEL